MKGISKGKHYANLKAVVLDNEINISITNAIGFSVEVPPQIDKRNFAITINKKYKFEYKNFESNYIYYIKTANGYKETKNANFNVKKGKGNGLLDVYLNSMRIIPLSTNEEINICAEKFSKPNNNSNHPQTYVEFPIINMSDSVTSELFSDNNLIIIDHNTKSEVLEKIRVLCPIKTDEKGYIYKRKRINGQYCIMQIIKHPYFNEKSILYLNTNNTELLKRNLITRKIIIPSYANGYHPFWNNDALIYNGKDYFKIFEFGMKIEKV